MSETANRYKEFIEEIPDHVKLVAVSKTKPVNDILQLYDIGHRVFGENKVQELTGKYESLPKDIQWHMVGHLQRNKVKYVAPFVSMIHSVDSMKLLNTIEKEGRKNEKKIDCLLQVHIASEETKFGFSEEELAELMKDIDPGAYPHVGIRGLMGMATFTEDMNKIRGEFRKLKTFYDRIRSSHANEFPEFIELSMGMSNDYKIAVEEGSTMIRIGSNIFGERNYH